GLEPSTYGLEIRCSIRLSYGRRIRTDIYRVSRRIKAKGATRSLLLLFRDKNTVSLTQKGPSTTVNNSGETPIYEGAGSRIRTDDLLITNQLLYQLSYAGKNAAHINAHRGLEQVACLRNVNAS